MLLSAVQWGAVQYSAVQCLLMPVINCIALFIPALHPSVPQCPALHCSGQGITSKVVHCQALDKLRTGVYTHSAKTLKNLTLSSFVGRKVEGKKLYISGVAQLVADPP